MLFTFFYLNNHSKPQTGKYKVFRFEVTLNPLAFVYISSIISYKKQKHFNPFTMSVSFCVILFNKIFLVTAAASVGAKRTSTRCPAPLYLSLSEFVNPYGRYNIRESSPAGLRLLGQYIYYDALVVHGSRDKLEGYGGKQNE